MSPVLPTLLLTGLAIALAILGQAGVKAANLPSTPAAAARSVMTVAVDVADVRAKPDARAELVTQAILGAKVVVAKISGSWAQVRIPAQWEYPGWIRLADLVRVGDLVDVATTGRNVGRSLTVESLSAPILSAPSPSAKRLAVAPLGVTFTLAADDVVASSEPQFLPVKMPDGRVGWIEAANTSSNAKHGDSRSDLRGVVETARLFLGTPYQWGGMTYRGVDCSGLVYMAFHANGIVLHRDSDLQFALDGETVPSTGVNDIPGWARLSRSEKARVLLGALHPGDLLFFDTRARGTASHVGLYYGDGLFLNASSSAGKVVLSRLDDPYWLERYLGAKRVESTADSKHNR